jgi:hypothetical protein
MTDFVAKLFGDLICILENLLLSLLAIGIWFVNGLVHALAAFLAVLIALMPPMPAVPTLPGPFETAMGWIAWVIPLDTIAQILDFALAMYVLWLVVKMALRWAKAGYLDA